jgi:hypothetical protein
MSGYGATAATGAQARAPAPCAHLRFAAPDQALALQEVQEPRKGGGRFPRFLRFLRPRFVAAGRLTSSPAPPPFAAGHGMAGSVGLLLKRGSLNPSFIVFIPKA